jgi:hypothetical protein
MLGKLAPDGHLECQHDSVGAAPERSIEVNQSNHRHASFGRGWKYVSDPLLMVTRNYFPVFTN